MDRLGKHDAFRSNRRTYISRKERSHPIDIYKFVAFGGRAKMQI